MDITIYLLMGMKGRIMGLIMGIILAIIMMIGEVHKDMLKVLIVTQIIVIITKTISHMAIKVLSLAINMIIKK